MKKKKNKKIIVLLLILLLFGTYIGLNYNNNFSDNNNKKITQKELEKYKFLKIKFLVMEKNNDKYNLYDALPTHIDDYLAFTSEYLLLEQEDNYYKVSMENQVNEEIINSITDYSFAMNNNRAQMLEDCIFDREKLEIKIPSKYYEEKFDNVELSRVPIQVEFLSRLNKKNVKNININLESKKILTKKNIIERNAENGEFSINAEKKYNDVKVYINNSKIELYNKFYNYDKKNGRIDFYINPMLVNDIKVVYNKKESFINNLFISNFAKADITYHKYGEDGSGNYSIPTFEVTEDLPTSGQGRISQVPVSLDEHFNGDVWLNKSIQIDYFSTRRDTYPKNIDVWNALSESFFVENMSKADDIITINPRNDMGIAYDDNINIGAICVHVPRPLEGASSGYVEYATNNKRNFPFWWRISNTGETSDGYKTITVVLFLDSVSPQEIVDADENNNARYYWVDPADTSSGNVQTIISVIKFKYKDDSAKLKVKKQSYTENGTTTPSGVRIGIYSDSTCSTKIKEETTNSNGEVLFDDLKVNTNYYINELDVNEYKWVTSGCKNAYIENSESNKVSDSSGNYYYKEVNYYNRAKRYCARVKKVDADDTSKLVSGIKFTLTNGTDINLEGTTGSDGLYTFNYLVKNTNTATTGYRLHEASNDGTSGYWNDGITTSGNGDGWIGDNNLTEMVYTLSGVPATESIFSSEPGGSYLCPTSSAFTYTKSDHKQYYCIKAKKIDSVTKDLVTGASFKLVNSATVHSDDWDGSNDGYTTFFVGSDNSSSAVQEITAPYGYSLYIYLKEATPFVLPRELSKSAAETECKNIKCTYNKNTGLDTCRYTPANSTDKTNGDVISGITIATIPSFPDSRYLLNWYKKVENNSVAKAGTKFTVKKNGSSTLLKFSATKESISDGTVTKACYKQNNSGTITELETDNNGEICIFNIEEGTYTVTETLPPVGHTLGSTTTKNVTAGTKFNTNSVFTNEPTKFEFTKTVSGSYSSSNKLNRTLIINQLKKLRFNIKSGNTVLQFKLVNGVYEYAGNEIDPKDGTAVSNLQLQTEVTNEFKMKFVVEHLPKGTYTIEEVENDSCTTSLGKNCYGNGFYLPSHQTFEVTNTYNSVATISMDNVMTQFTFTKNDFYGYENQADKVKFEDNQEIKDFDDITFKLKDTSGRYLKLTSMGNVGDCSSESSYSEYYYDPTDEGDGSTGTELHTCGGHIKINNLCRDTTYIVEEVAVPDGTVFILPDTHPTVTVTIPKEGNTDTNSNNKVTISDKPTRVVVQKKDNRTSSNIKGGDPYKEQARFKVYRCLDKNISKCTYESSTKDPIKFYDLSKITNDQEDPGEDVYRAMSTTDVDGGNTYVTTLKLNSNGKLILRYLPAGYKYVVVEENAPDGYYNLDTPLNESSLETSKSSLNISYPFTNYPTIIKFKKEDIYKYYKSSDLDKLNSDTKIFDSMTFVLRNQNGNIVNLTKTQDGEYRYIDINGTASGTVTEIHTKNGELLITHLYRNETYYIEETKADTEGNFILPNNIDNTSLVESRAGDLKNNKHPMVKYKLPNKLPDTSLVNAAPESLTELIQNLPTRVVFEKRDAKTGELIDDLQNEDTMHSDVLTTFNVYQCKKSVTTCTKNNGTLIYFEDRTYINDLTDDITVVTPPVLTYKYSKLNESSGMVKDLHTDRGVLVLAYLPDKYKYVLVETVAPNGYYNPSSLEDETEFTVEDTTLSNGNNYTTLTERVLNDPTEIHFIKSDIYNYYVSSDASSISNPEKIFDTMRFVLRDKNGKKLKLKCSENYNYKASSNGECKTGSYRYLPYKDTENMITNLQTIEGNMLISHLYRGETYYIEEVKADDEGNFILPDYYTYDDLPFDNKGHPVVKYILPETEPPTAESVTEEIKNVPTRVTFEKRDSRYGYLIPDETTTFNVYQCDMNVESCTPENGTLVYFEQRKVIDKDDEDYGKEVYKYSKLNSSNNAIIDLHPYKGDLILRYLPDTYKYVLVETVSPLNYVLPEGERAYKEFTISKTTVKVDEIDVPNKPTSLLIRKYNEDGDLLPGAEFRVYKVTSYDENRTPENQEKQLLKLKTIRDGLYDARELTDTDVIKTCKDEEYQKCSDINVTLTHNDYIDTWTNFEENSVNQDRERVEITEGEALIQYLEYNNYYVIEEVKAPNGYSLPKKSEDRFHIVHIVMESDVIDTNKQFVNKPTPFTFYKFDEYNNPLDGAKFKLQKLDDNKKYHDINISLEVIDDKYYYKVDPNSEDVLIETINGEATVYYLEEGQYRILEVEPADGYELPKKTINVATFFVDKNGNVYGNSIITNKKPTETTIYNPTAYAELIVNVQTGQERIKYGIIIGSILIIISSLIIYQNKKKDKKEDNDEKTKEKN